MDLNDMSGIEILMNPNNNSPGASPPGSPLGSPPVSDYEDEAPPPSPQFQQQGPPPQFQQGFQQQGFQQQQMINEMKRKMELIDEGRKLQQRGAQISCPLDPGMPLQVLEAAIEAAKESRRKKNGVDIGKQFLVTAISTLKYLNS